MHKDIEVKDPRGRVIRCSGEWWEKHILVKHPDLRKSEAEVLNAVQHPTHNCIYISNSDPSREVYYGPFRNNLEIKVVVAFDDKDEGYVLSATACSRRPLGEKLKWHQ